MDVYVTIHKRYPGMGDFLGSYFVDGYEAELYGNEQPATIVNFKDLERETATKEKWDAFDDSLLTKEEVDEDFSPVAVASMNSFDPGYMVGVTLTAKAATLPKVCGKSWIKDEGESSKEEQNKFEKGINRLKQMAVKPDVAFQNFEQVQPDEKKESTENDKETKNG